MENFTPGTGTNGITYTENGTTISNLKFTFKAPGETKTFGFDIKNGGSINAELLGVNGTIDDNGKLVCEPDTGDGETICGTDGKNTGAVKYQITYDNEDITQLGFNTPNLSTKKKLEANGTKHVDITVKYDAATIESTNLPTQDVEITLPTISFNYGQDDSVE